MSFADFEAKAERHKPRAAFLRSTSAATSRSIPSRIAGYCAANDIFLIEDCRPTRTGELGTAARPAPTATPAVYSMYATKTISTGEAACSSRTVRGGSARA